MIHDDDLARAYQDNSAPASGPHAEPERLAALAAGRLADAEKLAVLDHVMACPTCREEFELLRAVSAAGQEVATAPGRPIHRWLPLAAAVALAVGVLSWQFLGPDQEGAVRGGGSGVALLVPADGATAGASTYFLWQAVPGASTYRLEVVHLDGRAALLRQTADTAVAVDPAAPLSAGEYRWWVTAVTPSGEQTSPTRALIVR